MALSWLFSGMFTMVKNLSNLTQLFPAELKQDGVLPTCFSSCTVDKCPLHDLFSASYFFPLHFWAFC